jgi:hypothetical protein
MQRITTDGHGNLSHGRETGHSILATPVKKVSYRQSRFHGACATLISTRGHGKDNRDTPIILVWPRRCIFGSDARISDKYC